VERVRVGFIIVIEKIKFLLGLAGHVMGALIFYFCAVVYQEFSKGTFRVIREGSHIDLDEFGIVITICSLLVPILLYTKAKDDTDMMKKELDIKSKALKEKNESSFRDFCRKKRALYYSA
jgi:hypothetical protein